MKKPCFTHGFSATFLGLISRFPTTASASSIQQPSYTMTSYHLNKQKYPSKMSIAVSSTTTMQMGSSSPASIPMQNVRAASPACLHSSLQQRFISFHLGIIYAAAGRNVTVHILFIKIFKLFNKLFIPMTKQWCNIITVIGKATDDEQLSHMKGLTYYEKISIYGNNRFDCL